MSNLRPTGKQPNVAAIEYHPRRVAVDLTPLGPGGENGGAGLVAVSLVREFSALAPDVKWVLLTAEQSHAELAALDAPNVSRLCVLPEAHAGQRLTRLRHGLRDALARRLGRHATARLRLLYWSLVYHRQRSRTLPELNVDLYFCPLTVAFCATPGIPLVAIVYDLQHLRFPEFFTPEQRIFRQQQLAEICQCATRIVCISEHVRQTLLEALPVEAERAEAVPLPILQNLNPPEIDETRRVLRKLNLKQEQFLLFPANFWPHKNHQRLLEGFAFHRAAHPESNLRLVCTGNLDTRGLEVHSVAKELELAEWVRFPGRLDHDDLNVLLHTCRALIYPSLYEGFGMPVLEAMACGRPVLCSAAESLADVAGDAAFLFDPFSPREIARAMERADLDPASLAPFVARGRDQARRFGSLTAFARRYLSLFEEAMKVPC
jgi:glycosyltransferase involved in cell wall biosynthesis